METKEEEIYLGWNRTSYNYNSDNVECVVSKTKVAIMGFGDNGNLNAGKILVSKGSILKYNLVKSGFVQIEYVVCSGILPAHFSHT